MLEKNLKLLANIFKSVAPLYIVGGFIRDKLLCKNPTDVDLCSPLTLTEIEKLLANSSFNLKVKNKSFGTAIIYNSEVSFEYSVFRQDNYNTKNRASHSPSRVEFVTDIKLDASRRDFTINAIYYNLCNNQYYDFFNGRSDLNCKVLKMVTPTTLNYDGERILRLARFYVELDFSIEETTLSSAIKNATNVLKLSKPCIEKFLKNIENYSVSQKQKLKDFFKLLNLEEIKNLI